MFRYLFLFITMIAFAEDDEHWGYANNGTESWSENSRTCNRGEAQSPINIISGAAKHMSKKSELEFHSNVMYRADVIDNGHSIKVTPKRKPYLSIDGEDYTLLQFHYHGKSEHSVNGKFYDLVVHAVCQNENTKALVVVAVFYVEGKENKLLKQILNNVGSTILVLNINLPNQMEEYYHYTGSLTTPPCTENVQWYILKVPEEASKQQIIAMRKYYVNNFRPIQELHNRVIDEH